MRTPSSVLLQIFSDPLWSCFFGSVGLALAQRLTVNAGVRYEFNAPPYTPTIACASSMSTLQLQQVGANGVPRSGLESTSTTSRRGSA